MTKEQYTITNPKAYKIPASRMVKMTVEVAMDMVPGWGHEPEDHINFIFQNPYVQSITLDKDLVIDPVEAPKTKSQIVKEYAEKHNIPLIDIPLSKEE
jgi:hypothetical protein